MRIVRKYLAGLVAVVALVSMVGCGGTQALDKVVSSCESLNVPGDKIKFYKEGKYGTLGTADGVDTLYMTTYKDPEESPVLQCVRKKLPLSDKQYEQLLPKDNERHSGTMSGYAATWRNWGDRLGLEFALAKAS